jgi:predicted porin
MIKLRKPALALLLAGATVPAQAEIELSGDALRVYGKVHVSLDYMDSDVSRSESDASTSDRIIDNSFGVSSNSSRIGFRGLYPVNDEWNATYQLEQAYQADSGGGQFATRNTYLGLQADWFGELRAGRHDTPFKSIGGMIDELSDTVGDRRAILGASATGGNTMNARVDNMVLYRRGIPLGGSDLRVTGLYSADANDAGQAPDNNSNRVISVGATWGLGPLMVGAALEDWTNLAGGDARGIRMGAEYTFGSFVAGILLESIQHDLDSGGEGPLDREAFGLKIAHDDGTNKLVAQLRAANDYGDVNDSSAYMTSIGGFRKLGGGLTAYAVATRTSNDDNARYQGVDGGHGDELGTLPGGAPMALSAGAILKF